ncbi:MAG: succinyl-diaminopimelate desuccinylase [Holosporales bacterium]|jgi:succinyl-diaminopimelate desuccinylase|nr:succinyl-diaminopimelate desuccinylase [Holosporales bacterium]
MNIDVSSNRDLDPVSLAQKLIRCKSVTPCDDGVVDLAAGFLRSVGFQTHIIESGPPDWHIKNLYAKFGHRSPNLAVIGHLDVVPAGNMSDWKYDPFAAYIEDGILTGRGSVDMKSGFACAAVAAKSIVDRSFDGAISFLVTGDEEVGTEHGTRAILKWCFDRSIKFDACLVAEPTGTGNLGQAFCIGHRGSLNVELASRGIQGHVANPEKASNPLTPLIEYLHFMKAKIWDKGDGIFPPTNLEITSIDVGNSTPNLIPSSAQAKLNIRYNRLHSAESLIKDLKLARNFFSPSPDNLSIEAQYNSDFFICEDKSLINNMFSAIKEVLEIEPKISAGGGTTDGRFISKYCPVVEFGVPEDEMHKANESIAVNDLIKLTEIYKVFYKNFFGTKFK